MRNATIRTALGNVEAEEIGKVVIRTSQTKTITRQAFRGEDGTLWVKYDRSWRAIRNTSDKNEYRLEKKTAATYGY